MVDLSLAGVVLGLVILLVRGLDRQIIGSSIGTLFVVASVLRTIVLACKSGGWGLNRDVLFRLGGGGSRPGV